VRVAAQMVRSVEYSALHGKNPVAAVRYPLEAELYGLRITQMLPPIDDHRVPRLAEMRAAYRDTSADRATEANLAALGIVGSLGFLLSISAVLLSWPRSSRRREGPPGTDEPVSLRLLGFLTVSALLLGTVSGFGAVFAAAISLKIQAYNRISVFMFMALFALITLGVLADRFIRLRKGGAWRVAGPLVVLFGVLDQTPATLDEGVRSAAAVYAADATFGKQVQAELPPGASVFQLPCLPFPESPPMFGMTDCAPLRGYLHTTGLHWS
jgi:phosphoglycerol transferase